MEKKEIKIQFAKDENIEDIMNLLLQVHKVHSSIRPDIFKLGSTKYSNDELKKIIADDDSPIFVAIEGGKVIGYAFLQIKKVENNRSLENCKYIYIDDICVDEKSRGKGVATMIFNRVKEYSKEINCDYLRLNVWKGNEKALKFYEGLGFVELKREMEIKL